MYATMNHQYFAIDPIDTLPFVLNVNDSYYVQVEFSSLAFCNTPGASKSEAGVENSMKISGPPSRMV